MLAMMGVFDFVGTILSGWLSDRYDNRALLFWYYGLRGLSLLYLPYSAFTFYGLSLFAVFYGLDWIATVPPTVRLSARAFGKERAGVVFGWIFAGHQLGAAAAAFGAGLSRTRARSYLPALLRSRRDLPRRLGDRLADPRQSGERRAEARRSAGGAERRWRESRRRGQRPRLQGIVVPRSLSAAGGQSMMVNNCNLFARMEREQL